MIDRGQGKNIIEFVARALLLVLLAPLCLAQSPSSPSPPTEPDLLLQVQLAQYELSDGIGAYQSSDHVLLPLGELARLLTLAIQVSPETGKATGFILQETRVFHLDVTKAEVTLGTRIEKIDPTLVWTTQDEIYVASELLAQWLPVGLDTNLSALILNVQPRERLPLQQRLEREQHNLQANRRVQEDPGYPRLGLPYRLWEPPAIDHTVSAEFAQGHSSGRYTTFLAGDFLGLESAIFLTGTDQDPNPKARITLGRNDPDARLLGPLSARTFAIGTIAVPGFSNVSRTSATGSGAMISNTPLTQPFGFGQHSFQGDLPPGWDVELYFNDSLLAYQQSRDDGKYTFDDVPLVYGRNEFRLVFHGPQGQLRVERKSFLLDQSLIVPGQFYYRVAAHEDQNGHPRALAQFDWGLSSHLSATAGLTSLYFSDQQQRYTNIGLRAQWGSVFANGDLVKSNNGDLISLGLQSQLGRFRFGIDHAQLSDGFSSEVFQARIDPVRMHDRLRIDWSLPLGTLHLPIALEAKRDRLVSGQTESETSFRLSTYWHGLSLSNQLRWLSYDDTNSSDGSFQMGSQIGVLGLRGQINYNLSGETGITTATLNANRRLSRGYMLNAGVTRTLTNPETRYTAGLTKALGMFGLGVGIGHSTTSGFLMNAQFFLAMAREPRHSSWVFDALPMADSGSVSARVYFDKNLNNALDTDEELIKDAFFTVNGGRYPNRTDAQGIAFLSRLPTKQHVDISLDAGSLEDPQWATPQKGVRIVPRSGKITPLDFPVIMTSEIDGSVYLLDSKGKRGLGDITLELLDGKGVVVAQGKTASDGYYIVPAVPPGDYALRIATAPLKERGLIDTGTRLITISPEADFVNGVDFIVIPDKPAGSIQPPSTASDTSVSADAPQP